MAYYASAELGCHLALNWPMPARILDLYAEHRARYNGCPSGLSNGLVGALAARGLDSIGASEKDEMRDLILAGGPWTASEKAAILGSNGAGKTTLFNAISGLVRHTGEVRWAGAPLTGLTPAAIARGGIVQCPETRELFGDMTVRENLELGGHLLEPAALGELLAWLFDLFPILRERTGQVARTLSGGEQQMLAIARSLMMEPRLLILDEPTLGLAPVILETLSNALHRLRSTTRLTVLLGEQNVTFALPHADRLYVLDHGRLAWEGEPERFEAEAAEAYL